jgi:hypothetical protein
MQEDLEGEKKKKKWKKKNNKKDKIHLARKCQRMEYIYHQTDHKSDLAARHYICHPTMCVSHT